MGGFVITPAGNQSIFPEKVFGFSGRERILEETCAREKLTLFRKIHQNSATLQFRDSRFFYCGSLVYEGKTGIPALELIASRWDNLSRIYENIRGNFVLGKVVADEYCEFAVDPLGTYQVFHDSANHNLSTSLPALLKTRNLKDVSDQEIWEYLLLEAFFGGNTFFPGIKLLNQYQLYRWSSGILQSTPFGRPIRHQKKTGKAKGALLGETLDILRDQASEIYSAFGNDFCMALTGGFDSRLLLGCFRDVGAQPNLYVYGTETDHDVQVARKLAKYCDMPLEVRDRSIQSGETDEEKMQRIRRQFFLYDGRGYAGVFDNGSDMATRSERAERFALQLNGAGGEIFRNYWDIFPVPYPLKLFLKQRICIEAFSSDVANLIPQQFYRRFGEKIYDIFGGRSQFLTPGEIETLYPLLKMRFRIGVTASTSNIFGQSLTPFTDARLVRHSLKIPLRYKMHGQYEADLIAMLDPGLAEIPSAYGYGFEKPIPVRSRVRDHLRCAAPPTLTAKKRAAAMRSRSSLEIGVTGAGFLEKFFGKDSFIVDRWINRNATLNQDLLSRAYTLEIFLRGQWRSWI